MHGNRRVGYLELEKVATLRKIPFFLSHPQNTIQQLGTPLDKKILINKKKFKDQQQDLSTKIIDKQPV